MTTKEGIRVALKMLGEFGYTGIVLPRNKKLIGLSLYLRDSPIDKSSLERVCAELLRQSLVQLDIHDDGLRLTITPAGAMRLISIGINELSIAPMRPWDKKWRLVTFDIPASKSSGRQYFYKRLKQLGFVMTQKGLWFHPYDCSEIIRQVADYCGLARYISIFEVSSLDPSTRRILEKKYATNLGIF